MLFTTSPERAHPEVCDLFAKRADRPIIGRYSMIGVNSISRVLSEAATRTPAAVHALCPRSAGHELRIEPTTMPALYDAAAPLPSGPVPSHVGANRAVKLAAPPKGPLTPTSSKPFRAASSRHAGMILRSFNLDDGPLLAAPRSSRPDLGVKRELQELDESGSSRYTWYYEHSKRWPMKSCVVDVCSRR